MNIYPVYISKHNSNYEKEIHIYFNDSKWRRMALSCSKKLSSLTALLRGITSKDDGDIVSIVFIRLE